MHTNDCQGVEEMFYDHVVKFQDIFIGLLNSCISHRLVVRNKNRDAETVAKAAIFTEVAQEVRHDSAMEGGFSAYFSSGEVLCEETGCETVSASADHKPISKWLLDWYKKLATTQIDLTKHPDVNSKESRSVILKNNEL